MTGCRGGRCGFAAGDEDVAAASLRTHMVLDQIRGDPKQPRPMAGIAGERGISAVRAQERLLEQVPGVAFVTDAADEVAVHGALVGVDQRDERRAATGRGVPTSRHDKRFNTGPPRL